MRHLLVVAAAEPHGMLMTVARHIVPADGVLAAVGEGLRSCGTEELQEGQLDHGHWVSISVNVSELKKWGIMGKQHLIKDNSVDKFIA